MPTFIFDIDGTLAIGTHREHHICRTDGQPKDWDTYFSLLHLDTVNEPIAEICRALKKAGFSIVYLTGRPANCIPATITWLHSNNLPLGLIKARPDHDYTDDSLLKLKLLKELVALGIIPIAIFDDRARVVNATRAAGYTVLQVAPGDF